MSTAGGAEDCEGRPAAAGESAGVVFFMRMETFVGRDGQLVQGCGGSAPRRPASSTLIEGQSMKEAKLDDRGVTRRTVAGT